MESIPREELKDFMPSNQIKERRLNTQETPTNRKSQTDLNQIEDDNDYRDVSPGNSQYAN